MVANCQELITQYSTLVYVGIGLGKKVHSYFDLNELYRLMPDQNGGTSARNIAAICKGYMEFEGCGKEYLAQRKAPKADVMPEFKPLVPPVPIAVSEERPEVILEWATP